MADLIPEFGTTWHYARTSSGFSIRLGHQHGTHRFMQIAFINGTGKKQERLARAIAALPDLVRDLANEHHKLMERQNPKTRHAPGSAPRECRLCETLQSALEVQP